MLNNALIIPAFVCLFLSMLLWVGCGCACSESPDSVASEAWVERYGGVGWQNDEPRAIAVDEAGNVYVTGYIVMGGGVRSNYATVKYSSDGDRLWVAHYDGPAGKHDRAEAIALDDSGNVYVVGQSNGGDTKEDYAVVKYDSDGNELWVSRYDGPAHACDIGCAIAVDGSGNVYVSGYSTDGSASYDYATVKYDSSGGQVWASRYAGPAGGHDQAGFIYLDESDNVYVAGQSDGGDTKEDYAVVKYDSDGNELWVSRYDGPVSGDDRICGAFVDGSGYVYVSGTSDGPGTSLDYATLKYDAEGNQLWVARHDGVLGGSDTANTMAVDAAGNTYVMGDSDGRPTTAKYDTDGSQLWTRGSYSYNAVVVAVDGWGNVYAGVLKRQDCYTVKYDSDGDRLWVVRYDGPAFGRDEPCAMVVDEAGNIYIAACSDGVHSGRDWAIIKYTQ